MVHNQKETASYFVMCFALTFVPPTSSDTYHEIRNDDMTSYKLSGVEEQIKKFPGWESNVHCKFFQFPQDTSLQVLQMTKRYSTTNSENNCIEPDG